MPKLSVPYYSQWDADGSDNQNDCGPASLKMVLSYYGKTTTINDLNKKAGSGTGYTNWTQMQKAAKALEFNSELLRNQTKQNVMGLIDSGIPCIVVLHYGDLKGNQDDFKGPHILVITGYDSGGYFVNDPNFWDARREEGNGKYHDNKTFEKAWGSRVDGNQPFTIMRVQGVVPVTIPEIKVKEDISSYHEALLGLKSYVWYDKNFTWIQMFQSITEWFNNSKKYNELDDDYNDLLIERNEFEHELRLTQKRVEVLSNEKSEWMGTADEYLKKLNAQKDIVAECDAAKLEVEQKNKYILELESGVGITVALDLLVKAIRGQPKGLKP